jgi:hypothetical protein
MTGHVVNERGGRVLWLVDAPGGKPTRLPYHDNLAPNDINPSNNTHATSGGRSCTKWTTQSSDSEAKLSHLAYLYHVP